MSAEEVKHKSKTETDHRDNKFDLTVPAGEGRKVTEKTTVTSITTRYEGALRTEGSVGIEVNPGIWWSNVFWWYDNIEAVFPNAEATSHITRSSTNTNIDTKILKMPKPTDGREARRMEYFRFFTSDIAVVGFMGPGIAVSTIVKDNPPHRSPFLASMKIEVRFSGVVGAGVVGPEVPLEIRRSNTEEFKALILTNVHAIGNPGAITYASKFGSASFFIPYDPQKITYVELGEAVIKQAHGIRWRGHYMIYFS
jgi:hypothetical protein